MAKNNNILNECIYIPENFIVRLVDFIHETLQNQNFLRYELHSTIDKLYVYDENSKNLFMSVPDCILVCENFATKISTDMNFPILLMPSEWFRHGKARFENIKYYPKKETRAVTLIPEKEIGQIKGKIWNLYQTQEEQKKRKIGLLVNSLLLAKNIKR